MLELPASVPRPAAVAEASTVDEVRAAIADARARGLRLAVEATGHGIAALGPLDDALLLRVANLGGLSVDPPGRMARAAAGHRWRDVVAAAQDHALTPVAPAYTGLGVAGTLLGGGVGWLSRRHGLASSWVAAIELVAADGRLVRADHETERDLFWALRGGGGGVGVITAVELRLLAATPVYAGTLRWPGARAAEVLHGWAAWIASVPEEVTSIARLRRRDGEVEAVVELAAVGDAVAGAALVAPLRALGPDGDTLAAASHVELAALHDRDAPAVPRRCEHLLLDELPAEAVDALLEAAGSAAAFPLDDLELRHLGGALCRPPAGAGALATLDAEIAVTALALPGTEAAIAELADALAPWAAGHFHGSFAARPLTLRRVFTADAVRRLRAVKALHDPEDLFLGPYSAMSDDDAA